MSKEKQPSLVKLGENIREYREAKGISQEDLALEAGLDRTYVGGVERNPTVLSLLKLARPLGVDLRSFVSGVE